MRLGEEMARIPGYTAKRCTAVEDVGTALAWRFGGVKFLGSSMLLGRAAAGCGWRGALNLRRNFNSETWTFRLALLPGGLGDEPKCLAMISIS